MDISTQKYALKILNSQTLILCSFKLRAILPRNNVSKYILYHEHNAQLTHKKLKIINSSAKAFVKSRTVPYPLFTYSK